MWQVARKQCLAVADFLLYIPPSRISGTSSEFFPTSGRWGSVIGIQFGFLYVRMMRLGEVVSFSESV